MRKNKLLRTILSMVDPLVLLAVVAAPMTVFATSYQPPLFHRQYDRRTMMKGDVVYLFYSGTADVRNTIHVHDVLTVYHIDASCQMKQVGTIKILSYLGETYLTGQVLDGEIRANDIAGKDGVSCLVISAETCNR
jgi:hypothetical protein